MSESSSPSSEGQYVGQAEVLSWRCVTRKGPGFLEPLPPAHVAGQQASLGTRKATQILPCSSRTRPRRHLCWMAQAPEGGLSDARGRLPPNLSMAAPAHGAADPAGLVGRIELDRPPT